MNVRIPVSAGWFAFNDRGWEETVTGVAAARTGAELYPTDGFPDVFSPSAGITVAL